MELIRNFTKLGKADVGIAGGKGASLGEMTAMGISVPSGFVILSAAFEKFLEETDLNVEIDSILESVNHREIHTVENASERIKALILGAEMPKDIAYEIKEFFRKLSSKYVAVRSSATAEDSSIAAWAGQLESYLNTTEEKLPENIKKCWASLFTPRAIFYRFEKDLHKHKISVAVVVQKMVKSEKSGISFSVHPITQDKNQLIIEAGFGLGEAIVSGQITPDSYVVEKQPRRIIDKNVRTQSRGLYRAENGGNKWCDIAREQGEKQVLSDKEILELSGMILQIENHYGFPCDVEWTFEKGNFYIVQSRPITTLSSQIIPPPPKFKVMGYQRLFRAISGGVTFLASDIFAGYYKTLKCFLTAKDGVWTSYIPKAVVDKTLEEGLAILGNNENFKFYWDNFENYISVSSKFFEKTLRKEKLSQDDVVNFFNFASELFKYYSKTEFFYIDKAYLFSKEQIQGNLTNNLQKLETIKNRGREYLNKVLFGDGYVSQIIQKLNPQFNIPVEELRAYKISEITDLFNGSKLDEKTIKDRASAFIMSSNGETLTYFEGEVARTLILEFLTTEIKTERELRGVIANSGIAKGRIKIIPPDYYFDFSKLKRIFEDMERGDILVAETTSPELMPACQKAGAIITNQGGLLSHAAIVSREMNIPCIVGIENATEILKEGDKVEVDGNNGVVRVLK